MAPVLRLRLLGTPGIEGAAGPLTGSATQGQSLALLAVLACAGERGVAREKLFTLLWPETTATRASHRLSQLAHWARRRLQCPDLIVGTSELRLNQERVGCDLWEFVAARRSGELERAAELYGGPLLDGFFLPDSVDFERWVDSRRSALAREYQETLEALAVQAELRGDVRAAAGWWRKLAEHEPLSSRVTMHLMTALTAAGDRARALEQAQMYQTQVREELEAEPNPAVLALATQLRRMPAETADVAAPARPIAIGVLPLAALEEGPEAHALAQGLTEELTTAAATIPGVRVAARTSLVASRHATEDVREIGARLGLDVVLEGSVRQGDGRVRLTVRLVDVSDGCHLWTERYDRRVTEGFDGQDAMARDVIEAVRRQLAHLREQERSTGP
jgi:TolB-like protein